MAIEFGPKLGLPVHADEGENWYTALTAMLRAIDALVQCSAVSITASPPDTPADGEVYIVGAGALGDWGGQDNKVARWSTKVSAWEFYTPRAGWLVWVVDAVSYYHYGGTTSGWLEGLTGGDAGPVEEPDPLPRWLEGYGDTYFNEPTRTIAFFDGDGAAGSAASGYRTPYTSKAYFEVVINDMASDGIAIGIIDTSVRASLESGAAWGGYWFPGGTMPSVYMLPNGTSYKNGSDYQTGTPFVEGDRVGVAIDFAEEKAWLMVNGVAIDGGNPLTAEGGRYISDIAAPVPFIGFGTGGTDRSATLVPLESGQLHTPAGFSAWIPAGPP